MTLSGTENHDLHIRLTTREKTAILAAAGFDDNRGLSSWVRKALAAAAEVEKEAWRKREELKRGRHNDVTARVPLPAMKVPEIKDLAFIGGYQHLPSRTPEEEEYRRNVFFAECEWESVRDKALKEREIKSVAEARGRKKYDEMIGELKKPASLAVASAGVPTAEDPFAGI